MLLENFNVLIIVDGGKKEQQIANLLLLFFLGLKQNRRVASRQTPYSFAGPKEYAEKGLHLAVGYIPSPGFRGCYGVQCMGAGPFQGGLTTRLS